ncbi:type II toxin-antitoxin system HicB family antitoxin [Thiolapillus brandeum]|uniref:HicB-related protein n=1 Tax=Thiolapillus brandeum TaxID=1076588 RepID=A0A7U6JGP2_9GAMM|nr:type II toxin-antitoxin system HicB family antitoxin [Thiolapillus brandeum]BAO43749.1 HicB-related protein [Thiolapillus brandeum]
MKQNLMEIDGYHALISYDPEIEMFRGEFVDLNGGADFYARDIENLRREGQVSLNVFMDMCREKGIDPKRRFSGRFNVRIPSDLHARIARTAKAQGKSLNQLVAEALEHEVSEAH